MAEKRNLLRSPVRTKGGGSVIKFKACPKCRGDLELLHDPYGDYQHCLQCGYIVEKPTAQARPQETRRAA